MYTEMRESMNKLKCTTFVIASIFFLLVCCILNSNRKYVIFKYPIEKYSTEAVNEPPIRTNWRHTYIDGSDLFTYSAFMALDKVVVLTIRDEKYKSKIVCCVQEDKSGKAARFKAVTTKTLPILEGHGRKFTATFILCKLKDDIRVRAVTLGDGKCKHHKHKMMVEHTDTTKRKFTVCVSPINNDYDDVNSLVEMIELNKILGADHFVFYNYSIGPSVHRILNFYIRKGEVEVLPWHLPSKLYKSPNASQPEIHYFGQLAAINDCFYRNRGKSKYVVNQDLDEFIIPRNHKTWSEMMKSLPGDKGAYIIRSSFFRKDWPDVNTSFVGREYAKKFKSTTLLKQTREGYIFNFLDRSKYIADPTRVASAGIHQIWIYESNNREYRVHPEIALLHHYRYFRPVSGQKRVKDNRIMAYKDKLLESLSRKWKELKSIL